MEAKVLDQSGSIDLEGTFYDKLDFVLASIHRILLESGAYADALEVTKDPDSYLRLWLSAMEKVLRNALVDGIAHPFNLQPLLEKAWCAEVEEELQKQLGRSRKFVEFNVKYPASLLTDFWNKPGLKVMLSSDSHSTTELRERAILIEHTRAIFAGDAATGGDTTVGPGTTTASVVAVSRDIASRELQFLRRRLRSRVAPQLKKTWPSP